MTTYHGSGAIFDRFDFSFMGTGEGAQAYGWGAYVSRSNGVATGYRSGGRGLKAEDYNYVVFKESDLKIKNRVELMRKDDGTVYGWAIGNEIFLTPEGRKENRRVRHSKKAQEKAEEKLMKAGTVEQQEAVEAVAEAEGKAKAASEERDWFKREQKRGKTQEVALEDFARGGVRNLTKTRFCYQITHFPMLQSSFALFTILDLHSSVEDRRHLNKTNKSPRCFCYQITAFQKS